MKSLYFFFISLLILFSSLDAKAITNTGTWYSGANISSYKSLNEACQSFVDYNTAHDDRYVWSLYNITDHPTTFGKYYCNLNRDGSIYSNSPTAEIELKGFGRAASAERYSHDQSDLTYDVLPFWTYGSQYKGTTPKSVCDYLIEKESASTTNEYQYSHMEVHHIARYNFSPSWFNCIVKKRRIQKKNDYPQYPWGYYMLGTAKTNGLQENATGSVESPCESNACGDTGGGDTGGGDTGGGDTGGGDTGGGNGNIGLDQQTKDNIQDLTIDTALIKNNIMVSSDYLESIRDTNQTLTTDISIIKKHEADALVIHKQLEQDNIQIIDSLAAITSESGTNFETLIKSVNDSSASEQEKIKAISSSLALLENTNKSGYNSLERAIENIDINTDNSDLISKLNDFKSSSTSDSRLIKSTVETLNNTIGNKLRSINDQSIANTSSIVSAIDNIDSGSPSNIDLTSVESSLSSIEKLLTTDVAINTEPDKSLKSFWESDYPNGFNSVWDEKQSLIKNTSFIQWLDNFKLNIEGNGDIPSWSMCFDLVIVDLGCNDFELDSRIWSAIRIFILITAMFLCRRLVFGG